MQQSPNRFPTMEKIVSKLGKLNFLPWKSSFPPLEIYFSKGGKFLENLSPAERTHLPSVHKIRGRNRLGLYPILICRRAMPLQMCCA